MVSFTTNKSLGMPAVGGDTGVWGQPLNNNSSTLDASLGGSVTIPVSSVSGALTLLASNYANIFLTFTGAITQHTAITLPAVGSIYVVQNLTTNTSAFHLTLLTTAAGGQTIGVPPYEQTEVMTDGSNVKFRGLPHVGSYWDYAGSSVPSWVSACTVPPWLNCDGTAFSSATYPYLATILGSTTLPDSRGRSRAALNQGTGRMTSASGGVDGNTLAASGGLDSVTLGTSQIPAHIHTINGGSALQILTTSGGPFGLSGGTNSVTTITQADSTGGGALHTNMQPTYIGGLTMVRAG